MTDILDTAQARQRIFAKIRAAQHRPAEVSPAEHVAVDAYLAQHSIGPRPAMPAVGSVALREEFCMRAEKLSTTWELISNMAEAPAAVARYLERLQLPKQAVAWPTLQAYDWAAAGLQVEFRAPEREVEADRTHGDLVGITSCFCALAETGSLVMSSGPESIASTALLPETHIAIVKVSRIVQSLEDAFALLRAEHGQLARATNIISGPSRTGDIEQTIVLGAHGPYRVHLLLWQDIEEGA